MKTETKKVKKTPVKKVKKQKLIDLDKMDISLFDVEDGVEDGILYTKYTYGDYIIATREPSENNGIVHNIDVRLVIDKYTSPIDVGSVDGALTVLTVIQNAKKRNGV